MAALGDGAQGLGFQSMPFNCIDWKICLGTVGDYRQLIVMGNCQLDWIDLLNVSIKGYFFIKYPLGCNHCLCHNRESPVHRHSGQPELRLDCRRMATEGC